jgi:hypothetical protein
VQTYRLCTQTGFADNFASGWHYKPKCKTFSRAPPTGCARQSRWQRNIAKESTAQPYPPPRRGTALSSYGQQNPVFAPTNAQVPQPLLCTHCEIAPGQRPICMRRRPIPKHISRVCCFPLARRVRVAGHAAVVAYEY